MKLHLALLCLVPLVAGAITTTLEYEDTREAASRSAVSNEIATAVAPLASTNQLASATNAVAVALRDEIAASQPGDYANVSNKATTAIQLANIAPNFATPREYKPGDLVIKDGELCVCIQAGAGEYAVFMSAQVCDGIAQLRESLAAVALSGAYSDISGAPTNVSAFTNDAGYLTSFTEMDPTISSWAKAANKPSYTAAEVGALGTSGEQTIAGTGSQEITFSFGSAVPRFTLVDSYGNTTHVEADDSSVLRSPIWLKLPATDGTVALTSDIPASMAWGAITGKPTTISGYGITDALKSDFTSLTNNAAFTSAVAAVSPPTDLTHVEAEIETNRTAIATLSARAYIEVVSADEVYYVFMTNQE